MKVHRVVLCVIDFDQLGADGVKTTLENTRYPNHCLDGMSVISVETEDIGEWYDECALNQCGSFDDAFQTLFGGKS